MEAVDIDIGADGMAPWSGLIVLAKTGKRFSNQSGGVSCMHPSAEGWWLPFGVPREFEDAVHDELCYVYENVSAATEALVVAALATHFPFLTLDRERIHEMLEAWIPVVGGVLVYQNCD